MQILKKFILVLVTCGSILFANASLAVTYVCFDTTLGTFCMEMLEEDAPGTVANFLNYVRDGDYDNTFIHRSVPNFVVQGGGYKLDPFGDPVPEDPQIANEFKLSNVRGTVAMAKLGDLPDSASNQWFVNLSDNSTLDTTNGGFTVFARVVRGLNIVDAIGNSQRVNLTASLGDAFNEVPVLEIDGDGVGEEDLYQIDRVYITDTLPEEPQDLYTCTANWIASLQPAPAQVCMDTNMGSFCIDLMPDAAPLTVANFLHYVADGDYNSTFFHRSVKDFVVQTGSLKLRPFFAAVPTDPAVVNEFKVSNTRGTVAMAKADGAPDSATSQWFVNTKDNSTQLDANNGGFTVFGQINDEGMAVIDQIAALTIWNLSGLVQSLSDITGEVPLRRSTISGDLNTGDFVGINNAYIVGAGSNPCFPAKPAALTELANNVFEVPVRIVGGQMYLMVFERELNLDGYVFKVQLNRIRSMIDQGQQAATFTPDNGLLVIPSMVINGSDLITNVRLTLTDRATLQFTHTP